MEKRVEAIDDFLGERQVVSLRMIERARRKLDKLAAKSEDDLVDGKLLACIEMAISSTTSAADREMLALCVGRSYIAEHIVNQDDANAANVYLDNHVGAIVSKKEACCCALM